MKHLNSLSDRLEDLLEDFLIDVVELDVTYYYMWMWSRQGGGDCLGSEGEKRDGEKS